ncbi:hypothetical protein [Sporosarcina sp. P13]|uniref:hypothetical protein n=1 Tax=Sporosarcina sp. P13 TaxID=2048263 RepID=UPI00130436F7|nr:hypothetical protein [Sporosarcina sp. P13]
MLVFDFKEQISTDPTMALSEKMEELNNLNKAYHAVVEELIGTDQFSANCIQTTPSIS